MPNKNYLSGRRLEYKVKSDYENRGWHVTRASGSHSAFDLIAVKQENDNYTHIKFIQCKSLKRKLTDNLLEKLFNELRNTSPIRHELESLEFCVDVELVVKEHGTRAYTVYYPLEP